MDDKQKPRSIRALESRSIRTLAAEIAFNRDHPTHESNRDEEYHAGKSYPMSFTKGLEHDETTGLVKTPADFKAFRDAIDSGLVENFDSSGKNGVNGPKRLKEETDASGQKKKWRKWEAPTAGFVFDLEGPDAQAVTMKPAPKLGNGTGDFEELAFEMAEVYELALLRDVPFSEFENESNGKVLKTCGRLKKLSYKSGPRKRPSDAGPTPGNIFRGIGSGVTDGPYISQFLLIGNKAFGKDITDGVIQYGAQTIDQKVPEAKKGHDYMTTWDEWRDVQDGEDVNDGDPIKNGQDYVPNNKNPNRRFISTPRDLATYVHFDALYQAYLNAALILLSMKAPFDSGFAPLHGQDNDDTNVEGFALYGGPHILTLVTEVATRALKAVRYQKFNKHLRLRPEALAARIEKAKDIDGDEKGVFTKFHEAVNAGGTVDEIQGKSRITDAVPGAINRGADNGALLPMAFREGSPMHPSYGAGHATVAGACVTVLKAFFDTSTVLGRKGGKVGFWPQDKIDKLPSSNKIDFVAYQPVPPALNTLALVTEPPSLTMEGELNKLAANISIGRNMAGVHYYSDYYDSLLMGEEIAIGILEEQSLCYTKDPFAMSLRKFDGTGIRINIKGD